MTAGRLRLIALWLAIAAIVWLSRPSYGWIAAALPFLLVGEATRSWAAGHLHKTVALITSGPYAYTRNPLYLGRLAIGTGLALLCPLPGYAHLIVLAAIWALFFGYYLPRKERIEPARLLEHHGERYSEYRDAVPALWPKLRRYPAASDEGWQLPRYRRNREALMIVGLSLLVALQLWRAGS